MKPFKSKTINFSYILVVMGVIEMNLPYVKEQLGDYYGFILMGVGVVVAVLRKVTNKPLSER